MVEYTIHQLKTSLDALIWAAAQIPAGRCFVLPLPDFGPWPVARIVFHLLWMEKNIIHPLIGQDDTPAEMTIEAEEAAWAADRQGMADLIAALEGVREQTIAILTALPEGALNLTCESPWGTVSVGWLVLRVYQQTVSYTDTLLQMGLYWDMLLQAQEQARMDEGQGKDTDDGWRPQVD